MNECSGTLIIHTIYTGNESPWFYGDLSLQDYNRYYDLFFDSSDSRWKDNIRIYLPEIDGGKGCILREHIVHVYMKFDHAKSCRKGETVCGV